MSSLDFPVVHSDCPLPSPAPCPTVLREGNWEGMGQTEFPGPIASSLRAAGASCANATFYTLISTQYAVPKTRTLGKTMTGKDTPVSKVLALPCRNLSLISTNSGVVAHICIPKGGTAKGNRILGLTGQLSLPA